MSRLHWATSTTLTCAAVLSFLLAVSDILGFAVGSFWTVGSYSAALSVIPSCTARPGDPPIGDVGCSTSLGFLVIPAPWGGLPHWLAPVKQS